MEGFRFRFHIDLTECILEEVLVILELLGLMEGVLTMAHVIPTQGLPYTNLKAPL